MITSRRHYDHLHSNASLRDNSVSLHDNSDALHEQRYTFSSLRTQTELDTWSKQLHTMRDKCTIKYDD